MKRVQIQVCRGSFVLRAGGNFRGEIGEYSFLKNQSWGSVITKSDVGRNSFYLNIFDKKKDEVG